MNQPPKPPIQLPESARSKDPLRDEALAWIVHLHSGSETDSDWASFDAWRAFDDSHEEAAKNAEALWERLGPVLSRKRGRRIITGLMIAAFGLSAVAFAFGLFGSPASLLADYRTSVGEIRSVTLVDGSQVDLDTATSFDVGADGRNISLHTGQIFVAVKPDRNRPFSVKSENIIIQALGTAFAVRRDGEATTVSVTESAVSLSDDRETIRVEAGELLTYSLATGFGQKRAIDMDTAASWRRGEVVFDNRPLSDVMTEVKRYQRGKILVIGDAAGRLPVSGVFGFRDADTLFASIELALPVQVIRLPGFTLMRWNPGKISIRK